MTDAKADDRVTIERETTYTHAEVRKMLDGISADAHRHGLEVVDNLDGTMGLRAALAAQPAEPTCPDCKSPGLLYECAHCGRSNYPQDAQPAEQELTQFEADLIESVGQMKRGEVARVWRPAEPAEPVAWRIDTCEGTGYPAKWHFFDKKPDGLETFTKQPLYAAPPAPAAVPPGYALVPIEPTRAMVEAYLSANSAYWERIDAMPTKIGVWRNGTPKEATEVSYRAMIAAAGDKP